MATAPTPYRGRLRALEALLVACGIAFVAVFAWQVARLADRPAAEAVRAAPTTGRVAAEYQRAIAYERERLPPLFVDDATAARLGLVVIVNSFDLEAPPNPKSVFVQPLPGQHPRSPMPIEFFSAGFLIGKAESFQLDDVVQGRLTLVAWSFKTHEGAVRAFRAIRDVTGLPSRPSAYAPYAAIKGSRGSGMEELFWVRGRLVLQSSYAAPQDDLRRIRTAHRRLTTLFDRNVRSVEADPAPTPALPDLSPLGLLDALRIPDAQLPGGFSTLRPGQGTASGMPQMGLAAPSLDVSFGRLGVLGTHRQTIHVAGMQLGRYELGAQRYPDGRTARRALGLIAARDGARLVRVAGIGAAILVAGPGGRNYSDLWWRRGPLLLRASVYASRLAPLPLDERRDLARALDDRARTALALGAG